MNCVKCGKIFQDDAVFCPYCGKKHKNLPSSKSKTARANGTGSVYYDSRAKRWVAQIVTGKHFTEDMKTRFSYKRKYFANRTDALKAVGKLEEEKEARPDFTVSYYFTAFENGKMSSLSIIKQYDYRKAYSRLKTLWSRPVKDLTVNDLQAVISTSCESYYTAKNVRTVLNYIYKRAVADDRMINPTLPSLVQLPKLEETQIKPFTEEEQLKLWISYESGDIEAAAPLIMIYTGMMPGEMLNLTKDMIHLDEREIVGAGLKTKERKKKSVLLPDDIVPVLEDVMAKAETNVLYPMSKKMFSKLFHRALTNAGITRDLNPYSCRHTTATVLAVTANIAPQTLQRIMRWKSTRMMDRYVTPTDKDAIKAVNKI